ncbi:universal stress protein [Streptomyces caeni]|uniref:Universal stress protein n=1 Tax=Streptomyces caeni TaxID=2307231 RepID=A0ABW4IPI9_9ACTN
MPLTIAAGVDGSPESAAAAEWAAREAELRGLALRLVHVAEPVPDPLARAAGLGAWTPGERSGRGERIPREAAEGIRLRHPGVEVTPQQRAGHPAEALIGVAGESELLVLGSRGLSGVGGFLVGSVGLAVVAHAERPVVLVRGGDRAADARTADSPSSPFSTAPYRPVVLGLDLGDEAAAVIEFAFEEAAVRETTLRVVHGWYPPPAFEGLTIGPAVHVEHARRRATALTEALHPWRRKFPAVRIVEASRPGRPASQLIEASRTACLVVVGRRTRRGPVGTRLGSVAHAVLHHAAAPVAVVPHD